MQTGNIFVQQSHDTTNEIFDELATGNAFKLQRIISHGQSTPPGEWYDQSTEEWVVLLSGSASLRIENREELIELQPGDYVNIPAGCRHRVERTADGEYTVWLALHYEPC